MSSLSYNEDAELNVVGAMMFDRGTSDYDAIIETGIRSQDFYRSDLATIFAAASLLRDQKQPCDPVSVHHLLEKSGKLAAAGGKARIHEVAQIVTATSNAVHHAKIVREKAAVRRLVTAGMEIQRLGDEGRGDLDELMEKAEVALSKAVTPTISTEFASSIDGLDELLAEIQHAIDTGEPKMGLASGFKDLDGKLTGLHGGQLIIAAARPGMGKTALALNIAENVADQDLSVAFLSLEMSRREIQIRSLSRASRIDSKRLRTGMIDADSLSSFELGKRAVVARGPKLHIEDNPGTTLQKLKAETKRLKRQQGLDLLVVDYIQLMVSSQSEENRTQEISAISRGLKLLARELDIPVIALSQLNRNLEMRGDKRPMLSDLRESGSLEQDADVVLFIYRDDYYNPDSNAAGIAEIIIAKNRQGEQGTIQLGWVAKTTEFKGLGSGLTPLKEAAA